MNTDIKTKIDKVLLIIRDGWGYAKEQENNCIAQADTHYTDFLEKEYPTTLLHASGEHVGLPDGYFGNSEVGHMTIGAGRVLEQSLLRINNSIKHGDFFENPALLSAIKTVQENNSQLHLIGLLQEEGVHANFNHLVALLELAQKQGFSKNQVCIHVITDGRDSPKQQAIEYIKNLETEITRIGVGYIASMSGRYFAMDRNENWDRTEKYYQILTSDNQLGKSFDSAVDYISEKYTDAKFSDEFLNPVRHIQFSGISEIDAIIFYNFRKDRTRQLTRAFCESDFSAFPISVRNIHFVAMTEFYAGLPHVAFHDLDFSNTLGELLEKNDKTQLRISETEKYAHVTFFFDGGVDRDYVGEKKVLIQSPNVATFDLQPEMSSDEITEKLINELSTEKPDFVVCNFPNTDMVGHSGVHKATRESAEAVDRSLEKIVPLALSLGYTIMLTGDHGNAECKFGKTETSHTTNDVPFTLISENPKYKNIQLKSGMGLKNIFATVCKILDMETNSIHEKSLF